MSTAAGNRVLVAGALCVLVALALPSRAAADCCVCSDCPGGSTMCFTVDGCDFAACEERCLTAGCGANTLSFSQCQETAGCPVLLPAPAAGPAMLLSLLLLFITLAAFALRRRSLPMPIRAASLAAVLIASAAAIDALTQIRVSGQWQADGNAEAASDMEREQWKANLVVGRDGALSGTVELTGFGDVAVADVEGTLVGGVTSGTLRAPDGTTIAEFEGDADAHPGQGTFTKTQTGETGIFSWSSDS